MKASPATGTTRVLLGLSALIMIISLVTGGIMAAESGGGFFPNLGKALALLLIAAANFVSWLLNVICWYRSRKSWLGILVTVQGLPAVIFAGWVVILFADGYLDDRAANQRSDIFHAIQADDLPELQHALDRCGQRCQETFSLQRSLLQASEYGAHTVARYLLGKGARPYRQGSGATAFYDARTTLYTCEGDYLVGVAALDMAVAKQDMNMLALLWPTGDNQSRSTAMTTAARLDRLEILQIMLDQDDATHERGNLRAVGPEEYPAPEELLRAAASGAALEVGNWLLDSYPAALSPDAAQRALSDLLYFMMSIDTPRSVSAGQLLLKHGADINTVTIHDEPALVHAIRIRSKPMAQQLLELGADRSPLSREDSDLLDTLLDKPDRSSYRQNRSGCVAP